MEDLPPRAREFTTRVADLLREFADVAGPVENDGDEVLSAAEIAQRAPLPHSYPSEWVLLMAWQELDVGRFYVTKACQPGMPAHHQIGLLRSWLATLEAEAC